MSKASKAATAFRVSPSLFMSQRGLTAVLVVTALLITAGVKLHPAAGYKSCLLPISADPSFNRRLSGGQLAAWSEGTGSPVGPTVGPALLQAGGSGRCRVDRYEHGLPAKRPVSLQLLSIHPSTCPPGILKSLPLPLPEEIKASPSTCGHVAAEWAGSVSSWALRLPCKAPSVRLFLRCGRAVGGNAGGKINNKKKKKERNSSSEP